VIEINGRDKIEWKLQSKKVFLINRISRGIAFSLADLLVAVTPELAEHSDFRTAKAICYVPNPLPCSHLKYDRGPINHDKIRGIFLGTENRNWYGIRVIKEIARLNPDWDFIIVGIKSSFDLPNISFVPSAHGDSLRELLDSATFGIGSLAIEKAGLTQSSSIKVAEYFANGLPVVSSSQDARFIDHSDIFFQLRAGELPGANNQLRDWVNGWSKKRFFLDVEDNSAEMFKSALQTIMPDLSQR
jgi:glycosyltransferase involved in cell wall biosynthesis